MPIPKQAEEFLLGQGLDPAEYEIDPQTQDLVHTGGFTKQRLTEVLDFGKAAGRTLLGMPGAAVKALPILGSVAKRNLSNAADTAVRAALSLEADPTAGQRTAVDELGNIVPLPDTANKMSAEELAANPLTKLGATLKKAEEWVPPTSGVNKWAEAGGTIAGSIVPLVGEALLRKGYPSVAAGNLARSLAYLLPAGQQAEQVAERNIAHQQATEPSAPVDVEKAGARAAVAGLADLLLSKTVGGGSVVRAIEGAGAPLAKRAAVQGGAGMVEGGTSAAIQDKLAEGKVNPENVLAGAVGGGLAQGGMAAAFGKRPAGKAPATPEEAAAGFGVDAAKPAEAEMAAEKLHEPGGPLPVTDEQMALLLDPTRPYKLLPKKYRGPFDELLADAHAEQLLRTPADIHRLVSAENPVAEFRKLHAERMSEQPPSFEQPPADETAVKAEAAAKASEKFQKDLEALEKQRKTLEKEIEVLEQHPALGAGDKVVGKWKARQTIETVDERIRKLFAEYNATRMATAADEPRVRTTEGLPVGKLESGMPPRPVQIGGNEVAITPTPARPARPDVSPALQRVLAEEAAAALQEAPLRAAKQQNLGAAQDVANTVRLADVMQRRKDAEAERQKAQWLAGEDLPGSRAYSGLPPEIFRPLRDLLNLEGENRVPFGRVQSGSVERPPMPERAATLQEQAKLVADPRSPKKAMLVTGEKYDAANFTDADTKAYHYGDGGIGRDTTYDHMDGGRSTGHFGTGVYFVGTKATEGQHAERPAHNVDLAGLNLWKARTTAEASNLHESLRAFNRAIYNGKKLQFANPADNGQVALRGLKYGRDSDADLVAAAKEVETIFAKGQNDGLRTPSTYLMQRLGYDGIDVRGTSLDNTMYGSVVFAKPLSDAPAGLRYQHTAHGRVLYNPKKTSQFEVRRAGLGETFDGRLLGYNESLPAGDTVVTTKVNDVPDVVTEVTTAEKVPAVVDGQQRLTGGKGETTVTTPEEVATFRDKEGNKLKLYHGTGYSGEKLSPRTGYNFGRGISFTPDPRRASEYAARGASIDEETGALVEDNRTAPNVRQAYVTLQKPYVIESDASVMDLGHKLYQTDKAKYKQLAERVANREGYHGPEAVGTAEIGNELLREQGYDGIVKQRWNGEVIEVLPFEGHQIRAAYSTLFGLTPEDMPRLRKMLSPEQLHAGFGLSAVAELNSERPFGMDRMKNGNLPINGIRARMVATIPPAELKLYNEAGLEQWLTKQGGTINTDKLAAWMFMHGPQIEVKPLFAEGAGSPAEQQLAQMQHAYDSLPQKVQADIEGYDNNKEFPHIRAEIFARIKQDAPGVKQSELDQYLELRNVVAKERRALGYQTASATARFRQVNPKKLYDMPGAVDILVRVPLEPNPTAKRPDERLGDVMFTGRHFNEEDINILGWVRGYEETLPNGKKAFHVFEVQSDWGQAVRDERTSEIHPLLPEHKRLTLKAAIRHAIDNDMDYIALSDAETAMLTERHDTGTEARILPTMNNIELAERDGEYHTGRLLHSGKDVDIGFNTDVASLIAKGYDIGWKIPTESGMRLNYDQILPNILEELTGYKASKMSFGEHQNAWSEVVNPRSPRRDLVFKNPDGSPKTDITARLYLLDKVKPAVADRGGFTMFGKDRVNRSTAYSTLFGLTPEDFKNFRKMAKEPWNLIPRAIHAMTSGATDKMAARDPLLAAASERYKLMDRDSRRIIERKAAEADKYERFIKDKDVIVWLNNSTDEQKHDVSKLPAKWRTLGQEWVDDYIKSFHREQIANKVNVQDSNGQWRKPVDRPGYFPWAMSADVNERLQTGSAAERQRLEDIWVRNWKHFVPKATTEDALAALAEQRAELARVQVNQGQPLFSAVIREYGVPLPKEFRATPAESLDRYIQRWGKHMAWAKYAQNDPLMRRAFGITADSQGNDTTLVDSKHRMTNADWQDAFRAGQQVDAPWTWDATPAMYDTAAKEGRALVAEEPVAQDIMASYTGRSRDRSGRLFNSIQRLTSPIVMGHASKLRDIAQSGSTVAEYVPSVVQMAADVAKASADLRGAAREARAAGFLERDPFAHEGWNDVSTKYGPLNYMAAAVKKAAEGARDYLGMKHMDIASKILAFEPARAAVERELAVLGKEKSPLVKEFGPPPSQLKAMSDKDIIQLTANKIADVVTPRYSAENVPHKFLPQNKDALGMMFRLMTWSIARYNNWYKHNWLAATKQQRPMRLVKSLFYGTLGGAATATLLEFLRDKKPAKLTMTEWLGLDDDTKWRELAPLVGGYIDAQGSLGVLGWAANKGIMAGYGRPAASADLDPMLPALIAGRQLFETLASFAEHGMDKGWSKLDVHDLGRLSLELASIPQTGRDIVSRLGLDDRKESRDVNREVKVFEQVTGRSAKTGAPVKPPGFFFDKYRRNPFSLAKEVNEAKTLDDLLRLAPQLREERARGYELPAIQGDEKVPAFYQDVARRRGLGFARQVAERDVEEAKRDAAKRALLGR